MKVNIIIDTEDLKDIIEMFEDLLNGDELYWYSDFRESEAAKKYQNLVNSLKSQLKDKTSKNT